MLDRLIIPKNKENILIYLAGRKEGYAREIARYFRIALSPLQDQLQILEEGGIIISRKVGKTIVFQLNPRYPFYNEVLELLNKAISYMPESERDKLLMIRRRPRRKGKPL
jgi:predicted transcriptional regulator